MKYLLRMLTSALLIAFCLTACLLYVSASDADVPAGEDPPIDLQYISQASCSLSISGGSATASSFVKGYSGTTTQCSITLKLQKKVLFWWVTVETWEKTTQSYQTSLSGSCTITSGQTYRAVANITAWSGSSSESVTKTSSTVVAP